MDNTVDIYLDDSCGKRRGTEERDDGGGRCRERTQVDVPIQLIGKRPALRDKTGFMNRLNKTFLCGNVTSETL